ncbi:MAG: GTP-binding protein [Helicobacteraceae bacterium]|nr:GTP-binding protein [Helicobacteraceae bacterium]
MKYSLFVKAIVIPMSLFGAYEGEIRDIESYKLLQNVQISDEKRTVVSDQKGHFKFDTKSKNINIKAYGYKPYRLSNLTHDKSQTIELEPIKIKALYLSFWKTDVNRDTFKEIMKTIETTGINALVIDMKNEFGNTLYDSNVEEANELKTYKYKMVKDIKEFVAKLKAKDLYLIARVVVFKDNLQAEKFPERALKKKNGDIYGADKKLAWMDPYNKDVHKYTIDLAEEIAQLGFDEINFDYVRFPATSSVAFSKENTEENRVSAIETFLSSAKKRLLPYGVFTSADTYGNVCWSKNDSNIGHKISSLAKNVDYVAPMLYPSGFAMNSHGFKDPTKNSYDVIYKSITNIHSKIDPIRVRPWLQHFKDYAHTKKHFKATEIREQIDGSNMAQASGWMFWNPSSNYKASWLKGSEYVTTNETKHESETF